MAAIDELFATMCFPDDVAAFIVEPILGEGGYVIPSDTFLPRLRELADRHGILLITDEIQTGYGRTGRFFASEWTGAAPDIVVMAKGIASGLPLSGIMARRSLIDKFPPCLMAAPTAATGRLRGGTGHARRDRGRRARGKRRAAGCASARRSALAAAGHRTLPRCAAAA